MFGGGPIEGRRKEDRLCGKGKYSHLFPLHTSSDHANPTLHFIHTVHCSGFFLMGQFVVKYCLSFSDVWHCLRACLPHQRFEKFRCRFTLPKKFDDWSSILCERDFPSGVSGKLEDEPPLDRRAFGHPGLATRVSINFIYKSKLMRGGVNIPIPERGIMQSTLNQYFNSCLYLYISEKFWKGCIS